MRPPAAAPEPAAAAPPPPPLRSARRAVTEGAVPAVQPRPRRAVTQGLEDADGRTATGRSALRSNKAFSSYPVCSRGRVTSPAPLLPLGLQPQEPCGAAPALVGAAGTASSSSSSGPPGNARSDEPTVAEYRLRFFNFNMANSSSYQSVADLQGPGGRGPFVSALRDPLADGGNADIVFATLVETRLNLSEWVQEYTQQHRGERLDRVLSQNARREGARNTRSRVRGWVEGIAASYNGNLKNILAFSSASFEEDPKGVLFGRLTEAKVLQRIPVPNPKKAFLGRSVQEVEGGDRGVRLCFVGAHFPLAKLAAALEDTGPGIDQLHAAKAALARSLWKVLRKACKKGIADERTALFLQGDLNSRTVLRQEATENEYCAILDRASGQRLGLVWCDSAEANGGGGGGGPPIITGLCGGAAEAWNREHPYDQVRIGDCIVEVNGVREPARLLEELRQEQVLYLRLHRKATDVLLEVLRDPGMQLDIQQKLGLPPGRWHEVAEYATVHDLPVTYKFLDHTACLGSAGGTAGGSAASSGPSSPSQSPVARLLRCEAPERLGSPGGEVVPVALTIGDIMSSEGAGRPRSQDDMEPNPSRAPACKGKSDDEVMPLGIELYRRHLVSMGEEKLVTFGLVYRKSDFRAFRFPACADRVLYWAPDALYERLSFEVLRGGYEVNHAQLGSDHRPVGLEVVLRVAPQGVKLRSSSRLQPSERMPMHLVLEQSDPEGRDSDEEGSAIDAAEEFEDAPSLSPQRSTMEVALADTVCLEPRLEGAASFVQVCTTGQLSGRKGLP